MKGHRSLWELAYAPASPRREPQSEPLPGVLFDITVVTLFVVLGIANLM
ncbi:MAG: hypothetical protein JSS02_23275 [Planctomycetes bacterium]|nr:hypothetical protein [Planctomycetota bacterium]